MYTNNHFNQEFEATRARIERGGQIIRIGGTLIFLAVLSIFAWIITMSPLQRAKYQCAGTFNPEQCVKMLTE